MAYPIGSRRMGSNYYNTTGFSPSTLGNAEDSEERAKDLQKYLNVLAQQRLPWEPMIDNIIMYVNHGRRFVQDWDQYPGMQTGQEVYDDSAMLARNILTDGMVGYLCSRNQPWFGLELPGKFNFPTESGLGRWNGQRIDSYPEVQRWLQEVQTVMYSAFNRSNFYDVVTEFVSDGATAGTAHMLVEENIKDATIVFTVPHYRECFIAENEFGEVDTCFRVFTMTLKQFAEKFGMEVMKGADKNFEKDYKANMYDERQVLHAIYPRRDFDPSRIDAKNKKWASSWVYQQGGKILNKTGGGRKTDNKTTLLSEGGYDTMPILSWRWRKNNDEVYGRGPAHDAFVSIAQGNQMGRTNLITAQQAAEPPLIAFSDMRGAIQRGPNGITYVEANRGDIRARAPMPLTTGVQNLPFNVEYQDRVTKTINSHFHTDVFMMMSQLAAGGKSERMVTEQIAELQGEKAAILGTRVGNLQSEAFNPLINRVYAIEVAAGRIPEPPAILLQSIHGPVQVEYLGPLAQAQTRLTTIRSIQSFLQVVQQVAQFDPTITHAVNAPEILRVVRDAMNAPVDIVYDAKTFQSIVEGINKVAAQQRQAETLPKLAKAASALAKQPEAGSILSKLMGNDEGSDAAAQ